MKTSLFILLFCIYSLICAITERGIITALFGKPVEARSERHALLYLPPPYPTKVVRYAPSNPQYGMPPVAEQAEWSPKILRRATRGGKSNEGRVLLHEGRIIHLVPFQIGPPVGYQ